MVLDGPEAPTHPDCARCPARCCHTLDVHVTAHDLRRICDALTVPAESFVCLTTTPRSSPDSFLLSGEGAEYELVLDRRPGCVFLLRLDEAGRARCGVYEHRPMVCRAYPFFPTADADVVTLTVDADALCPPPLLDVARVPAGAPLPTLFSKQVERDVHRLAIDRWNRWVAAEATPAADAGALLRWLLSAAAATTDLLTPILEDSHLRLAWCQRAAEVGNPLLPRPHATPAPRRGLAPHLRVLVEALTTAPMR